MRFLSLFSVLCLISLVVSGCPKRSTGEIDVDEIQSHVDAIEKHLGAMRDAMKAKNLDEAQDQYDDAVEIMEEEAAQLAAYPEVFELKARLDEAGGDLCVGYVDFPLQAFFEAIRAKEVNQAASMLGIAQRGWKRCESKLEKRDDFFAVKMNIESAPQELDKLKKDLAKAMLAEQVAAVDKEVKPQIASIRADIAKLEKNPNQRELALTLDKRIKAIHALLDEKKEFHELPEWIAFASRITGELGELDQKRDSLVRRGKVLWAVSKLLPEASRTATQAVAARDRKQALAHVEKAVASYRECAEMVTAALAEEPGLAKFKFKWRGGKKSVAWLKSHCKANLRITERMASKLGGKIKARKPEKAKPDTGKKPDEGKKPPAKKKKKKKRRGRIKRW